MTRLVHIGLAKAASTYLQTVWHLSPKHGLHDVRPFLAEACEQVRRGRPLPAMTANPVGPGDVGGAAVISSEGLSQAYLNETAHQRALPRYRKEIARSVARAGFASQALLVVREPRSWLRSLHEQSLKQGEYRDFRSFLDHQRSYIAGVTDLAALAADWCNAGMSLVVLPVEWLREDEGRFWATLEERTGLPTPPRAILERVRKNRHWLNRTVADRRSFLQQANRFLAEMRATYGNLKGLPPEFLRERSMLSSQFGGSAHWVTRRIAEYGKDTDIERLSALLAAINADSDPEMPDAELLRHLHQNYLGFLDTRDDFPADLLSRYRESLDAWEATADDA
ncbi:MAG: hypothetical protein D6807_00210 [Alphaproteobacteria bacterium]|nr:MAG: hypothetical protein D6807_00210 [Alphaproteobacteria bacterium]